MWFALVLIAVDYAAMKGSIAQRIGRMPPEPWIDIVFRTHVVEFLSQLHLACVHCFALMLSALCACDLWIKDRALRKGTGLRTANIRVGVASVRKAFLAQNLHRNLNRVAVSCFQLSSLGLEL